MSFPVNALAAMPGLSCLTATRGAFVDVHACQNLGRQGSGPVQIPVSIYWEIVPGLNYAA